MRVRATAPGSLLLVGEYAVTEEGGLGLSVATAARAVSTVVCAWGGNSTSSAAGSSLAGPSLTTRYGGHTRVFDRIDAKEAPPIVAAVARACAPLVGSLSLEDVELDSRAFYLGRRKLGYGSSAAVAIALTASILAGAGRSPSEAVAASLEPATRAHWDAQGGRGSGYDVATSHSGGAGLFTGGIVGRREIIQASWLPRCYLYSGPRAVSTPQAIGAYLEFKSEHPGAAGDFLKESNEAVTNLSTCTSWDDARPILTALKDLLIGLGSRIGVTAEPDLPSPARNLLSKLSASSVLTKSLGAGNETGIMMVQEPDPEIHGALVDTGLVPLSLSAHGAEVAQ